MRINTTKQYRNDLTQEDFENAAKQLASQSKELTIRGIKELVGGSNETISKFIREYKRNAMIANFKSSMPNSYQEKVISLSVDLFNFFEAKITEDRISLQDEFDRKHSELNEIIKDNDANTQKLNEKLNAITEDLNQAKLVITEKDKRISMLEAQLLELNELNSKLSTQLDNSIKQNQQKILEVLNSIANK